jgi:hypothetical protein
MKTFVELHQIVCVCVCVYVVRVRVRVCVVRCVHRRLSCGSWVE